MRISLYPLSEKEPQVNLLAVHVETPTTAFERLLMGNNRIISKHFGLVSTKSINPKQTKT